VAIASLHTKSESNEVGFASQASEIAAGDLNALTATNLEQWKHIIKGLAYSDKFGDAEHNGIESWIMEQTNREVGIPVLFGINGKAILYSVSFIDVHSSLVNGLIHRVEMQSPNLNIDETRKLGLNLCNLLKLDPKDFELWCDKVGNHWVDAPLFSSNGYRFGFETLRTFDDKNRWFINFVIVNRQK
jgi:hypothetical protein